MVSDISTKLIDWYLSNHRDLPWRQTTDPYRIWLSEIILQQTRVAQGLGYYQRFTERYPDVSALAAADEADLLKLWQGLGYYTRARNLHAAARQIVQKFGGQFPNTYPEVRALPGVGDYTAAAICSFAYSLPYAVLDGNVHRVLSRLFDIDLPIDQAAGKRCFQQLADELLDRNRPALSNQAIMEFGALQCTPGIPGCANCPTACHCLALKNDTVNQRPVKRRKTETRPRYFNYLDIRCKGKMLLHHRTAKDIWQNLYELPLIETNAPVDWSVLCQDPVWLTLSEPFGPITIKAIHNLPPHQLSHQTIHATVYEIATEHLPIFATDYLTIDESCIDHYAVSRLTELYWHLRNSRA